MLFQAWQSTNNQVLLSNKNYYSSFTLPHYFHRIFPMTIFILLDFDLWQIWSFYHLVPLFQAGKSFLRIFERYFCLTQAKLRSFHNREFHFV